MSRRRAYKADLAAEEIARRLFDSLSVDVTEAIGEVLNEAEADGEIGRGQPRITILRDMETSVYAELGRLISEVA